MGECQNICNEEFPIKISSKSKEDASRKGGMNLIVKDRLDDVVREIHMSFMTKDFLIKLLNEKFSGIPKKGLDNFFKESCIKIKKAGQKVYSYLFRNNGLSNQKYLSNSNLLLKN